MIIAVLPIKPPSIGKARLAGQLEPEFREELAMAMYADSLASLVSCRSLERVLVVTSDRRCREIAGELGAEPLDDPGAPDHSAAAELGIEVAAGARARAVLLVPGDCPAVEPGEIDRLVAHSRPRRSCAVVPDRHGTGTNALLIAPPGALAPAFGPGSRERHLRSAEAAGLHAELVEVPSLALDVDTPSDLAVLAEHLAGRPGVAPLTRALLDRDWSAVTVG